MAIFRPNITKVLENKDPSLSPDLNRELGKDSPYHSFDPRFYFPHFQPIVDIPSGAICGYESLVRTLNQAGDVVSAGWIFNDEHIDEGVRVDIDRAVRSRAMHRFANDPQAGMLFINVSPQRAAMLEAGKEAPTLRFLRESGIDPSRVVIEITEQVYDIDRLKLLVEAYRSFGLKVAVDDFGVGGSQIDRIEALQPDFIKIDMDIFKRASRREDSSKLLATLSAISECVHFEVICEGVENEDEFHFAVDCGAQKIQGWLFGQADATLAKPHASKALVKSLQTNYLKRKKQRVKCSFERNNVISKYVNLVFEYHRQQRMHELDSNLLYQAGLTRYYLCDLSGEQISANIEFSGQQMITDESKKGCCWSHRPYFALVEGLENRKRQQVVSRPYIDCHSKNMCRTSLMYMDDNTLMLVDSIVYDDVLYCDQSSDA